MPDNRKGPQKRVLTMRSPWLASTLRSMGISAAGALNDLMPATGGTVKSAARLATETATTLRQARGSSQAVQNAIKNNQLVKTGQDFFRNAINDLKSGDWHEERGGGGYGFDDSDIDAMFGDLDDMFEGDESTQVNVENVVEDSGASIRAIQTQTEYTVKAAKATVDTMVSLGSASLMKAEEIGNKVLNELTGINSTLNALLEYQNSNMTRFIEASIGYYEQMSATIDTSVTEHEEVKAENLYSDRGMDFSTYKDYIMQNVKRVRDEDFAMVNMFIENLPNLIANPIDMVAKMGMTAIIPEVTKQAMAKLDQSMKDFIPYLLERIGNLGEGESGMFGTTLRYIGKIFGTKTTARTELDFSDIKKGPVPYNGKANHTIVEIIPKYLRESNNYLRVIAEHLTGQTEDQLADSVTGYDWKTGRFRTIGGLKDDLRDDYITQVLSSGATSEFGKKFLARANMILGEDSDNANLLNQVLMAAIKSKDQLNFKDGEGQIEKILAEISGNEAQKNFVQGLLEEAKANDDEILGNYIAQQIKLKNAHNTYVKNMMSDENISNTRQMFANRKDEDIVQDFQTRIQTSSNTPTVGTIQAQSVDEIKAKLTGARNDEGELEATPQRGGIRQDVGNAAAKKLNAFAGVLNGIMAGNADQAWDAFIGGFKNVFNRAGEFLSEHFFNPIKNALFGERDNNGYIQGGIFGGINNRIKESFYGLRRMITGKGYTDAEGNTVPNATEEEMQNTVVGKLRNAVTWMKDAISIRLFGEKDADGNYKKDEDGKDKDGILGKAKRGIGFAASSLLKGISGWKQALFGKTDGDEEEDGKKTLEELKKKAAEVAPSALAGGIGGGILGLFVGGPIGGALLGMAAGIASQSDKFKNWLFGEEKDGKRVGGVISKETQDYFKKNGKFLAGGAVIGAIKGTLFPGAGILTSLVGGPVAGALLGLGTSVLLRSEMFTKFIFGDEKSGQLGMKQHFDRWMRKLGSSAETGELEGSKLLGMAGIGAMGGGILGMMVGGPVLGALGGLSLSIIAQKDNFKEWLFGKTDEKTGVRKEGVLGQFKNMLAVEVLHPIRDAITDIGADFKTFFKYDILGKASLVFERIGDSFFGAVGRITGTAMASLSDFGNYIKENFLSKMVDNLGNVFRPIVNAGTTVAKGVYAAGKAIVSAPLNIMLSIFSPAVSAVTTVVGTVGSAMLKTVDLVLLKPLNALVLKPLGAAVGLAGKVIAAPFKAVAGMFNWVNETLVQGIGHVSRFFSAIGDHVKTRINEAIIEPVKNAVTGAAIAVKRVVMKPVDIVVGLAKDAFTVIKEYTKEKVKGFFQSALDMLNPFNWIRKAFNLGGKVLGFLTNGLIGGKGREDNPQRGWLGRLWEETRRGTGKDYSSRMVYKKDEDGNYILDEDGNRIIDDSKMTYAQRVKALKESRDAEKAGNALDSYDKKKRRKNEQLIRKYTKNQRFDDTEENRALAEAAAGHKINWKDIDAKKSDFESKTLSYQEEGLGLQEATTKYLRDIAEFIMAGTGRFTNHDTEAMKLSQRKAQESGATVQAHRDARQDRIDQLRKGESYHAKQDAKDAKMIDKRLRKREDRAHATKLQEATREFGLIQGFKNAFAYAKGRVIGQEETEVPANAQGTEGAKPGYSIVGEKGPEVVYGKDAKFGRFVGLHGPEVIKMKGGETVIPNDRIPRYEDGVGDFDVFKAVKNAPMVILQPIRSAVNLTARVVTAPVRILTRILTAPFRAIMTSFHNIFSSMGEKFQEKVDTAVNATLHYMNPLTWMKGAYRAGNRFMNWALDYNEPDLDEEEESAEENKAEENANVKTETESTDATVGAVKSDDALAKTTDTTKLSIGERILLTLNQIKDSIIGKVAGSKPTQVSPTSASDMNEIAEDGVSNAATVADLSNSAPDSTSTDMVDDGKENSMADQQMAQAAVSGKTGEAQRVVRAGEKAEEEKRNWMQKMLDGIKGTYTEVKEHGINWRSIFSKKGLLTGALMLGIPFLLNWLRNFKLSDFITNIGDAIKEFLASIHINFTIGEVFGNITDNIKNAISHFFPFLDKDKDTDEDPVLAGVNAASALIDTKLNSLIDLVNPIAKVFHNEKDATGAQIENSVATRAKNNMLFWQPLRNDYIKTATTQMAVDKAHTQINAFNAIQSQMDDAAYYQDGILYEELAQQAEKMKTPDAATVQKLEKNAQDAQASAGTGVLHTMARQAGRVGVLTAGSSLVGNVAGGVAGMFGADEDTRNMISNVTTAGTAAALTVNFVKSTVTGQTSLIDKILDLFLKLLNGLAKLLKKDQAIAKIAGKIDGLVSKVYNNTIGKVTNGIASKISAKIAEATGKEVTGAVTLGIGIAVGAFDGLASGLCSVEHLFQVMPGQADSLMKTISGLMQAAFHALEWTPVVGVGVAMIDVLDTILTGIFGMGLKQLFAQNIYCWVGGDEEHLTELQAQFRGELDYYNEEYGADLNLAAFNDMVNNTGWFDKLIHGSVGTREDGHLDLDDAGGRKEGGLFGLFTGEKKYVKGADGKVVKDAKGNAVEAVDANGNKLKKNAKLGDKIMGGINAIKRWATGGDIYEVDENGEAIWDEATQSFKVADHKDNAIQRAGAAISEFGSNVWKGVSEFGSNAWTTIKGVGDWFGKNLSNTGEMISGAFTNTIDSIKNGDLTGLWAVKESGEDDGMFGKVLSFVPNLLMKVIGTPIAGIVGAGKFIASPFISIFNQAKAGIERASEEFAYGSDLLRDKDSHLEDYFKIEDDEENPLGGLTKAIIIGSRLVSIPAAVLRRFGGQVADWFKGIINATKTNISAVGKNTKNIFTMAVKGDPSGVWNYKLPEDDNSPVNAFTQGAATAVKFISMPIAGLSWVGKGIGEALRGVVNTTRNSISSLSGNASQIWSYATQGNFSDMWNYTIQEDLTNPLNGVNNFLLGALKFVSAPVAGVSWLGQQITSAIRGAIATTQASISSLAGNASNIVSLAIQGKPGEVWNMEVDQDPMNPLNGVNNFLLGGLKLVSMPIAGISWVGHQVAGGISDMIAAVQTGIENLSEGNAKLYEYSVAGDPGGMLKSKLETDEGNPVGGIQGFIYHAMKIVHLPVATIRWVGRSIGEWFTNATKDIGTNREALSKGNENLATLASKGDLKGVWNSTLNLKDNDPIRGIWSMAFGISKLFNSAVAIFNNIIGPIMDTVEGIQKGISDFTGNVSDFAKNATDTVGSFLDSIFQGVKDYVTGGSGGGYGEGMIRGGSGEPSTLNGIPYFSQNDSRWANKSYEKSGESEGATMSTTGCGPTAMSMVINKMNGKTTSPTELANFAQQTGQRDDTGTNWNFIDTAANAYGINSTRSEMPSKEFITTNLSSGNPMVLSGQSGPDGPYTSAGHYIVATGIDSGGNIIYNDPRGSSYSGKMNINQFINNTGAAWTFDNVADMPRGSYGISSVSNRQNYEQKKWIRGGKGTGVMARDVVAVAENEVGYIGKATRSNLYDKTANPKSHGSPGYCKYAEETWPGKNNLHWCAMFVCWCMLKAANGDMNIAKELMCGSGWSAGCDPIKNAFKAKGQLIPKNGTPQPGDLVLFNWDNGNDTSHAAHVGLVVGTNGDKVITIEGNTGNGSHTCGVCAKKERSRANIIYFCRVLYDDVSKFNGITGYSSINGDASGNTSMDFMSTYASLMSAYASAAFEAALTGNTDIDWNAVFSGTSGTGSLISYSGTGSSSLPGVSWDVDNTEGMWRYLKSLGYSDIQAAGILGCWTAESSVKAKRVEADHTSLWKQYYNGDYDAVPKDIRKFNRYSDGVVAITPKAGDGSGYYANDGYRYAGLGYAQWTGGRSKHLLEWSGQNNLTWYEPSTQLAFAAEELSTSYKSTDQKLRRTTDVNSATEAFGYGYEHGNMPLDMMNHRKQLANSIYKQFAGKYGSTGMPTGGGAGEGVPYELSGIQTDATVETNLFGKQEITPTVEIHTPWGDKTISGGSGVHETPVISSRRYKPAKRDTGGSGNIDRTPIRSTINEHEISKMGSSGRSIIRGASGGGSGYDDSTVVQLLSDIAKYLNSISTDTKHLDLLTDTRDVGSQTITLNNIQGGNTQVTNVSGSRARQTVKTTGVSRQETRARQIAGV